MQTFRILVAALTTIAAFCISEDSQASYREYKSTAQSRVEFDAPTLAPLAYTRFCLRYEDECRKAPAEIEKAENVEKIESVDQPPPPDVFGPFVSDFSGKAQLIEVNRLVNRTISPRRYVGAAAFDSWTIAPEAGDCNDYAITKRSLLRQSGWPADRLLLAEVQIPSGEHHLVLVVRLDDEDVVLDNLSGAVRNWTKSPYRWVRMQSATEGHIWQTLRRRGGDLLS